MLSLNAPSVSETPRAQPPAAVTAAAREEPRVVGVAAAAIAESARAPTDSADENQKHGDGLPASPPALDPVSPHAPAQSPPPPSSSTSSLTPLPIFPPPYYDGGMFCSELVAALYQRLGLLDAPFPARHDYVPADFAQSLGNPVGRLGVDTDENATAEDNTNAEVRECVHERAVYRLREQLTVVYFSYSCRWLWFSPGRVLAHAFEA